VKNGVVGARAVADVGLILMDGVEAVQVETTSTRVESAGFHHLKLKYSTTRHLLSSLAFN
jgi:hypothetical protein